MTLTLKALLGAFAVLLIQLFAQSKNYHIAGLVPLFPTFALISHYIVGTQRNIMEFKASILFGILALIPYFFYLISAYLLIDRYRLSISLSLALAVWIISATILIMAWEYWPS